MFPAPLHEQAVCCYHQQGLCRYDDAPQNCQFSHSPIYAPRVTSCAIHPIPCQFGARCRLGHHQVFLIGHRLYYMRRVLRYYQNVRAIPENKRKTFEQVMMLFDENRNPVYARVEGRELLLRSIIETYGAPEPLDVPLPYIEPFHAERMSHQNLNQQQEYRERQDVSEEAMRMEHQREREQRRQLEEDHIRQQQRNHQQDQRQQNENDVENENQRRVQFQDQRENDPDVEAVAAGQAAAEAAAVVVPYQQQEEVQQENQQQEEVQNQQQENPPDRPPGPIKSVCCMHLLQQCQEGARCKYLHTQTNQSFVNQFNYNNNNNAVAEEDDSCYFEDFDEDYSLGVAGAGGAAAAAAALVPPAAAAAAAPPAAGGGAVAVAQQQQNQQQQQNNNNNENQKKIVGATRICNFLLSCPCRHWERGFEPADDVSQCRVCDAPFFVLTRWKKNCQECGCVCCSSCLVPVRVEGSMRYSVKVCRPCAALLSMSPAVQRDQIKQRLLNVIDAATVQGRAQTPSFALLPSLAIFVEDAGLPSDVQIALHISTRAVRQEIADGVLKRLDQFKADCDVIARSVHSSSRTDAQRLINAVVATSIYTSTFPMNSFQKIFQSVNTAMRIAAGSGEPAPLFTRDEARSIVAATKPFIDGVKFLLRALPPSRQVAFRGVPFELLQPRVGARYEQHCFTSTSSLAAQARRFARRTMMVLMTRSGVPISFASFLPNEKEILLPPGVELEVVARASATLLNVLHFSAGKQLITLREVGMRPTPNELFQAARECKPLFADFLEIYQRPQIRLFHQEGEGGSNSQRVDLAAAALGGNASFDDASFAVGVELALAGDENRNEQQQQQQQQQQRDDEEPNAGGGAVAHEHDGERRENEQQQQQEQHQPGLENEFSLSSSDYDSPNFAVDLVTILDSPRGDHMLLVGHGGTGKTAAAVFAQVHYSTLPRCHRALPVFLPLSRLAQASVTSTGGLDAALATALGCDVTTLHEAVRRLNVVAILDSLDETTVADTHWFELLDRNPATQQCRVIMTSRPTPLATQQYQRIFGKSTKKLKVWELRPLRAANVRKIYKLLVNRPQRNQNQQQHQQRNDDQNESEDEDCEFPESLARRYASPLLAGFAAELTNANVGVSHCENRSQLIQLYLQHFSNVEHRILVRISYFLLSHGFHCSLRRARSLTGLDNIAELVPCRVEDEFDENSDFSLLHRCLVEDVVGRYILEKQSDTTKSPLEIVQHLAPAATTGISCALVQDEIAAPVAVGSELRAALIQRLLYDERNPQVALKALRRRVAGLTEGVESQQRQEQRQQQQQQPEDEGDTATVIKLKRQLAQAQVELGDLLAEVGDAAQARELHETALATLRKFGDTAQTGAAFLSLANDLVRVGDVRSLTRALPLCQKALDITKNNYGGTVELVASQHNSLAGIFVRLNDVDEARRHLEDAKKILGHNNSSSNNSMMQQLSTVRSSILSTEAAIAASRGDVEQQEALAQQALAIDEQMFGDAAPAIAPSLSLLATALFDRGNFSQCRSLLERALALVGDQTDASAHVLTNLAEYNVAMAALAYHQPGNVQRPITLLQRAAGQATRAYRSRLARYGGASLKTASSLQVLFEARGQLATAMRRMAEMAIADADERQEQHHDLAEQHEQELRQSRLATAVETEVMVRERQVLTLRKIMEIRRDAMRSDERIENEIENNINNNNNNNGAENNVHSNRRRLGDELPLATTLHLLGDALVVLHHAYARRNQQRQKKQQQQQQQEQQRRRQEDGDEEPHRQEEEQEEGEGEGDEERQQQENQIADSSSAPPPPPPMPVNLLEAIRLLERSIAIYEARFGSEHQKLVVGLLSLVKACAAHGLTSQKLEVLQRAARIAAESGRQDLVNKVREVME